MSVRGPPCALSPDKSLLDSSAAPLPGTPPGTTRLKATSLSMAHGRKASGGSWSHPAARPLRIMSGAQMAGPRWLFVDSVTQLARSRDSRTSEMNWYSSSVLQRDTGKNSLVRSRWSNVKCCAMQSRRAEPLSTFAVERGDQVVDLFVDVVLVAIENSAGFTASNSTPNRIIHNIHRISTSQTQCWVLIALHRSLCGLEDRHCYPYIIHCATLAAANPGHSSTRSHLLALKSVIPYITAS